VLRRFGDPGTGTLDLFAEDVGSLQPESLGPESLDAGVEGLGAVDRHLNLPAHHDLRLADIDLKRLHATLTAAADRGPKDFADLLLTPGVGARTVASLAFVAEVIHGAPCRFKDPARFSLAHGGKDGHPFPVPLKVYDETIAVLKRAVGSAKLGRGERLAAIKRLDAQARLIDSAQGPSFADHIAAERENSSRYGGRTV